METIFLIGAAMNIFRSATECNEKGDALRKQILDMNNKISDIQDKYSTIMGDIASVDQNIITEIQANIKIIDQLKAQIKLKAASFNDSFKLMQLGGVIIITIVFFLLLLKYYGMLHYLNPFGPFIQLWNSMGTSGSNKTISVAPSVVSSVVAK
jgi:hypothetical protein